MVSTGPINLLESYDDTPPAVRLQLESSLGEVVKAFFQPKQGDRESLQQIKTGLISRLFSSIEAKCQERGYQFSEMAPCFLGERLLGQINWAAFTYLDIVQQSSLLASSLIDLDLKNQSS